MGPSLPSGASAYVGRTSEERVPCAQNGGVAGRHLIQAHVAIERHPMNERLATAQRYLLPPAR